MTRDTIEAIAHTGAGKLDMARNDTFRYLTRAAVAGSFIFAGALISCLSAAWFYNANLPLAKLLGASTFSTALILILLLGGDLFTGTNLIMGISLYEGTARPMGALRVWVLAWVGNLAGIVILCLLLAGSGASQDMLGAYLAVSVPAKLGASWYVLLLKGVLCNFLVCVGVFSSYRMRSESGKIMVIVLVVTAFVLAGLEHSIANMAYFSLYLLLTPGASFAGMGWNLLWVTLGNLLGGAVVLGLPLWYAAEPKPTTAPTE